MEGQGINHGVHTVGFSSELTGQIHKISVIFHQEIPSFSYLLSLIISQPAAYFPCSSA